MREFVLNYDASKGTSKKKDCRYIRIGNHLQVVRGNLYGVGATTFDEDILPSLTEINKVVPVQVTFSLEPKDGYTKVWIYGAKKHRRVSSRMPHRGRVYKDRLYTCGNWWLDSWCCNEYFPEMDTINGEQDTEGTNWFFEAFIKVERV